MPQTSDLFQHIFLLFCFTLTLALQLSLLIKSLKAKSTERLSPSILINVFFWSLSSVFSITYMGYRGLVVSEQWNLPIMFVLIVLYTFMSTAVSGSVAFVLLDRILVLLHPIDHKRRQKSYIFANFIFSIFVGSLSGLILCLTELPLDNVKGCFNYGCVLSRNHGVFSILVRGIVAFVNLVIALVFQWVLISFKSISLYKRQYTKANNLTLFAFGTEFLCNLLPILTRLICEVLKIPDLAILGPYPVFLYAIGALGTALIYRFVIMSKRSATRRIRPIQSILSSTKPRNISTP